MPLARTAMCSLAREFQQRGHDARLYAAAVFEPFAREARLPFKAFGSVEDYESLLRKAATDSLDRSALPGTIRAKSGDELDNAVGAIIRTTFEIGLPRKRDFNTLDEVKALLRDPWSPALKWPKVAVLFEKEKLAVSSSTVGLDRRSRQLIPR
jgi:hypothetical protein